MHQITTIQEKVFTFYEEKGRHDLPWRKTTDRYVILVSEVMLQQTQVDRVIPKFETWLQRFPTVESLAAAPIAEVLKVWSGLGYNSRGKRLQDAAKIIVEEHAGIVPQTVEGLLALPGVGPYTARSVLIFADNADLATVDTNIRRIFIHEFSLSETITDKELFALAQELLPKGRSRDWHNALMDYGATFLTSRKSGIKPKSRQSKFAGSRRWYRGAIMRHLTTHGPLTISHARGLFNDCPYDIATILDDLVDEGLVRKKEGRYLL